MPVRPSLSEMSIPDPIESATVAFSKSRGAKDMEDSSGLGIQQEGTAFFVVCPYDLDGLEVPSLGPYPTRELASRAQDHILITVTGSSE